METFVSTILTGLMVGSIYALLALGLVLLYKATGVVNLAHGGVLVLGAYMGYELMVASGMPVWLGFILTILFGVFMGLLLDRTLMRPMIGQSPFAIFVLTLVVAILIDSIVILAWGGEDKYLGLVPLKAVEIFGVRIAQANLYSALAAIFLFVLLVVLFRYTKIGLAMRCVCEDVHVSQALGINVKRVFTLAWVAACVIAVVSGVLYGIAYAVNPTISAFGLVKGLPVILLGGLKSIEGAFVGGLLVGVIEIALGQYVEPLIHYNVRVVAVMTLMLLVLLFRPTGLFGEKEVERI